MKILYAASNNSNAKIQLSRFLQAMQGSTHQMKVAAFIQSTPRNVPTDWTLDCLLNLYKPEQMNLANNDNLRIYFEQVKYYAPDLVISDLEYFTSYIAQMLNIPIWQCSSSLISYALTRETKYGMGIHKNYGYLFTSDTISHAMVANLLDNATRKMVYSHLGDTLQQLPLSEGFEWVRPYHQLGKANIPCQHFLVAGLANSDKKVLAIMKKYSDSVAFIDSSLETLVNPQVKDIRNQEEYFCNLRNSPFFLCQGQTSFLADAFYNSKYPLIVLDYNDAEAVLNTCASQHLGLASTIDTSIDLPQQTKEVSPLYNVNIKYLHEKVNHELCMS